MITSKRMGLIRIALQLINEMPASVSLIFSTFIPLRAEIRPEGWVEYVGICEQFEECQEGFKMPQYDFIIERKEDNSYHIKEISKIG